MVRRFENLLAMSAILGSVMVTASIPVRVSATPEEPPAFTGRWQRDPKQSDDPRQKIQEAMSRSREEMSGRRPPGGFGGRPGSGRGPGAPGPGRRGGPGAGPGGMGGLMSTQENLETKLEGGELHVASGENVAIYYLDGEKHQRQTPDGSKIETTATLVGLSITIREKSERGFEIQRTFELSREGNVMVATVSFKPPRAKDPVVIRTVYQRVEEEPAG